VLRKDASMDGAWALAFGIGFVAGLRTMTAPAVVGWAARVGWLHLGGSPLAFMGSTLAAVALSIAALAEFVVDLLPATPRRTAPGPLAARIASGAFCGACVAASAGIAWVAGAVLGGAGAVAGAFLGYQARRQLVRRFRLKDALVAIPEDLLAIALALALVAR